MVKINIKQVHHIKSQHFYTLKADLKRCVLTNDLKVDRLVQSLMGLGSEFQREGAAMEKALSPQVRCLVLSGVDRRLASEERRQREPTWLRCSVVGCFLCSMDDYKYSQLGQRIHSLVEQGSVCCT